MSTRRRTNIKIPEIQSWRDIPIPPTMTSLWKSAGSNAVLTTSLFYEQNNTPTPEHQVYTLGDEDFEKDGRYYYSLKKRYLEAQDPLEYDFATRWFPTFEHWKRISNSNRLGSIIQAWRDELELSLRSRALKELVKSSESGNFNASKFLVEKGWAKTSRGRPSKAEVQGELKKQAMIKDELAEDFKRINLKAVK